MQHRIGYRLHDRPRQLDSDYMDYPGWDRRPFVKEELPQYLYMAASQAITQRRRLRCGAEALDGTKIPVEGAVIVVLKPFEVSRSKSTRSSFTMMMARASVWEPAVLLFALFSLFT